MADANPKKRVLIYPSLQDPRWFQLGFLFSFVIYALTSPGFSRRPIQFLVGVATVLVLDSLLIYFYRGILLAPVSGLISTMGLLLLCDSPYVWPYAFVGALSVLSKHFIRIQGKHIFNPLNFGIVVAVFFLSNDVTVTGGRWGGSLIGMVLIACLGLLTVYRAKRLDVALVWTLTFFVGAVIRSSLAGAPLLSVLSPLTGAAFQLFTFFMITDPMTTPETRGGRIAYGVAMGVLDGVLRYKQVPFSPFLALFVLAGFLPLFRRYFAPQVAEQVWKPREAVVGGGEGAPSGIGAAKT
jgi:enediyne biosynthesis protein E5